MSRDDEHEQRFRAAVDAKVPLLYFNGFVSGLGLGDVYLVLERNGDPAAIVNMSYTVAKSLAISLGSAIAQLEAKAGREMLTTKDVENVFAPGGDKQK